MESQGLSSGDGAYDEERFSAIYNHVRQWGFRGFEGPILFTNEKPDKWAALERDMVANRSAQNRMAFLECIKDGAQRDRFRDLELHFAGNAREIAQMEWKLDPNHAIVCTSTDKTAGRSRTMGLQLLPALAEAYTCPPVVPKYTPQGSSESTAMASRSTLT